jgi:hypothetical protein
MVWEEALPYRPYPSYFRRLHLYLYSAIGICEDYLDDGASSRRRFAINTDHLEHTSITRTGFELMIPAFKH